MLSIRSPYVVLVLAASLAACNQAPTPLSDSDVATIRANIEAYASAALAGDWDGWGQTLADDIVYMPPNQPPVIGRAAAVTFLKTFPTISSVTLTPDEIAGSGDLAYARGRYSVATTSPDGSTSTESGSFLEVHRRQPDGAWLYTHVMWHSDSPAAAPDAAN